MKKLHPITIIILGLIIVSVGFHFLQHSEIGRLKKQLYHHRSKPIIIDMNPPSKMDIKPPTNRSI